MRAPALFAGLLLLPACAPPEAEASSATIGSDCTLNGQQLWGKVRVVDHFADFDVQVVDHFEDLRVQRVENFATSCGRWEMVDHFEDFTVRIVNHFPDFKIRYVDNFPGVP